MHCCKINLRVLRHFTKSIGRSQQYTTPAVQSVNENPVSNPVDVVTTDKVDRFELLDIDFPPVVDLSAPARRRREREEWHDKVRQLGTVEEKIFELNMPMYYGWKTYEIQEDSIPYDPLPHAQYITRTHVVNEQKLPDYYNNIISPEALDGLVQAIKGPVEDALLFEYNFKR